VRASLVLLEPGPEPEPEPEELEPEPEVAHAGEVVRARSVAAGDFHTTILTSTGMICKFTSNRRL
jgi:hypothetical protein